MIIILTIIMIMIMITLVVLIIARRIVQDSGATCIM